MSGAEQASHTVFWGIEHDESRVVSGQEERPVQPTSIPYLMELGTQLFNLSYHRYASIETLIREYKVDKWARLARVKEHNEEVERIRKKHPAGERLPEKKEDKFATTEKHSDLYKHNKALILELLMTSVMYRTDSPVCSRANCPLLLQTPYNHAQGGYPDITVDYGDRFTVHVEVSANKDYSDAYLRYELDSTLKHMQAYDVDWALLVTPWDYAKTQKSGEYKTFMETNQEEMTKRSIIILSIWEMGQICYELAADWQIHAGKKRLTGRRMQILFRAVRHAQDSFDEDEDESDENVSKLVAVWADRTKKLLYPKKKRTRGKKAGAAPTS